MASAGDDAQVRLWDAATLELQATLAGHAGPVMCLAFSPDGQMLATGGAGGAINIWDVQSLVKRFTIQAHSDTVHSLAFAPDGLTLASGSADRTTKVWELNSPGSPITTVRDPDVVYAVAISPDNRTLASSGFLRVWSIPGGQKLTNLGGHSNHVRSLEFSPDGRTLASASEDMTIRIWHLETNTTQYIYRAHMGPVYDIAFSPQGNLLACASKDGAVRLWDPTVPQDRRPLATQPGYQAMCLTFSRDGRALATTFRRGPESKLLSYRIADAKSDELLRRSSPDYVSALSVSPDGRYLALGCEQGAFVLYDTIANEERTFENVFRQQTDCAFSPDGKKVAVAGVNKGSVTVLDVATGAELARLPGQRCVAFSPDGGLIAMESEKSLFAVELWDLRAGKSTGVLLGHTREVLKAVFSVDGRLLATGSEDATAKLWDVAAGRERFTLRAHSGRVKELAFTPEGRTIATASLDGTVMFWDVRTGHQLLRLPVATACVASISFSPDGRILATGSGQMDESKGQVDLWYAPGEAASGSNDP